MKSDDSSEEKNVSLRLVTPPLTKTQRELLERYCVRYQNKLGPALLFAAMREIRRELGEADVEGLKPRKRRSI
jgi:hypothetical protein